MLLLGLFLGLLLFFGVVGREGEKGKFEMLHTVYILLVVNIVVEGDFVCILAF